MVARGFDEGSVTRLTSVDLGGGPAGKAERAPSVVETVQDVPLESELGIDYAPLKELLAKGEFEKADDFTRAVLITMADKSAGLGAAKRGYVYFTEVKSIPVADLRTVDELWKTYSGGKFGYSVQKGVWLANRRNWQKFFKAIDWVVGEDNNYRQWPTEFKYTVDAKRGHLPLTAALRGTQLHQSIMEHPAFEAKKPTLSS